MEQGSKPVVTRELAPGLRVYHVEPQSAAAARRSVNGRVDHVRRAALAIRRAVASRRHPAAPSL
ncbi:MAG: hypothetical protein ACRD12_09210 [Acidimicrobiales bacterium]